MDNDSVVLKNNFYPTGLTKLDIYDYYMKNRKNILNAASNREVMLFIFPRVNSYFVKRKDESGNFIVLNNDNYEEYLYKGRAVSIHGTMNRYEDFGIIDIDYHRFADVRYAAGDVYRYLSRRADKKQLEIRYTGKSSFHIIYKFNKSMPIDDIRTTLHDILIDLEGPEYTVGETRSLNRINLDISSNKFKGGFILPNALSIIGLRCMVVDENRLPTFCQEEGRIL